MLSILVVVIISLYLSFRAYIKFALPFWSQQPVFHWYDLHYHLTDHRRVERGAPPIDAHVNLFDISTTQLAPTPDNEVTSFIWEHSNRVLEPPDGQNYPSFLSTYRRQGNLYGAVTSRSLYIRFKGQREIPLYYVDHLCVHTEMRKRGIAHQLIRTHYYQSRRLRRDVDVYLFKRVGNQRSLVPLVTYRCVRCALTTIPKRSFPHASSTLIEINEDKLTLFFELVRIQKVRFECVVLPDLATVAHRLGVEEWRIYGILERDRLKAAYVFHRDGRLLSSLNACEFVDLFQVGFEQASRRLSRDVTVHQLGDSIRLRIPPQQLLEERSESLYLYNYITHQKKSADCLILN